MEANRNIYWLIAGGINFFTALIHTIGGQLSLVNPLQDSNLLDQTKAEWVGAWHMVTILLFLTSYLLVKNGLGKTQQKQSEIINFIGVLYISFSVPFIVTSLMYKLLAPQWILLLPIGLLGYFGTKKLTTN
jgi:hypothetical protein